MATAIIVTTEDASRQIAPIISPVVSQAQALTVVDGDSYEMACELLKLVANKKKQVEETFDPIVKKAHGAHKEAVAQMKKFMGPLEMAELAIKGKVSNYRYEQERIRREEEMRQAEALRKEQERQAIEEATRLEAHGESELAEIVLQEAAAAPPPVAIVQSSTPKVEGISGRENWKWRFAKDEGTTLRALVAAAVKDDRFLAYLSVNEKALGAAARTQKKLMKVPGVEVYNEPTVSVKAS